LIGVSSRGSPTNRAPQAQPLAARRTLPPQHGHNMDSVFPALIPSFALTFFSSCRTKSLILNRIISPHQILFVLFSFDASRLHGGKVRASHLAPGVIHPVHDGPV